MLRAAPRLALLARAWAAVHRTALPAVLGYDAAALVGLLARNGCLDFRELNDDDIAAWFAALGAWPAGMPATADPATAGVTPSNSTRPARPKPRPGRSGNGVGGSYG